MEHVLLTGATGVVGNALLHNLLETKAKIYLLIRFDNDRNLDKKLESLGIAHIKDLIPEQIEIIQGDISLTNLGISQKQYNLLTKYITTIIHSAASVNLNQTLELARQNALVGTRSMVDLALRCDNLKHFNYLSTVGVNGCSRHILLEDIPPQGIQYHNTYEQAKAEAEIYIFDQIYKGFPCTIYRPSMIVGHSKSGEIYAKQVFYYICDFLKMGGVARLMPKLNNFYLDTIPIDFLAGFINKAAFDDATIGRVFNVCAGYDHAITLDKILNSIQHCLELQNKTIPQHLNLPISIYYAIIQLIQVFSTGRIRKQTSSLSYLLSYLKQSPKFSNNQYISYANKFGLEILTPQEYLPIIINAWLQEKSFL
jgi:thioester reductase-like protein